MRIANVNVKPSSKTINPEFWFEIELMTSDKGEIPIEISGSLFASDEMKLSNIYLNMSQAPSKESLKAESSYIQQTERKSIVKLVAPLNKKSIDYIETLRTQNKKGDVSLILELYFKYLFSEASQSHIMILEGIPGPTTKEEKYKGCQYVVYKWDRDLRPTHNDMNLISANSDYSYISAQTWPYKQSIVIHSSEWVHDFAPAFEIGKFTVIEYPCPDIIVNDNLKERFDKAVSVISIMEEDLLKGEWNKVIEDSRAISELFKKQDEIKQFFLTDGYSEDAYNDLSQALGNLFNFTSKFHHALTRDKKEVRPAIKASKEDAYLIFSLSVTLVNLISKKIHRHCDKVKHIQ